jgi:hypothetical protein
VLDSYPFSIGFAIEEGPISTSSGNAIFRRGQPFPSVKMLTFHKRNTFSLEAFYTDPTELPPGASTNISKFVVLICSEFLSHPLSYKDVFCSQVLENGKIFSMFPSA